METLLYLVDSIVRFSSVSLFLAVSLYCLAWSVRTLYDTIICARKVHNTLRLYKAAMYFKSSCQIEKHFSKEQKDIAEQRFWEQCEELDRVVEKK